MIEYLDSFVDTKRKRVLLVKTLCWLGLLFQCGCALYTVVRLWGLSDYASLFSLLNDASMSLFVVSRMVLSMMSLAKGNIAAFALAALDTLYIWEWMLIGVTLFLFYYSAHKRWYGAGMLGTLLYLLGCALLFARALAASSLQEVVDSVRLIGVISGVWFSLMLFFVLCRLFATLRAYHRAMAYHVVECYEQEGEKQGGEC